MGTRAKYGLIGALLAAALDLAINLFASSLQEEGALGLIGDDAIPILLVFCTLGAITGWWLGKEIELPLPSESPTRGSSLLEQNRAVLITRLRALLSYTEVRGRGVRLDDILLLGSRISIETKVDGNNAIRDNKSRRSNT